MADHKSINQYGRAGAAAPALLLNIEGGKMLYNAMQVKEIPIIFRGMVDGLSYKTADDTINNSSWSYDSTAHCYWTSITTIQLAPYEKIYMSFDGVFYGELTRKNTSIPNTYRFGAGIKNSHLDTTDYPVMIDTWNSGSVGVSNIYVDDNNPHVIEIWTDDPVIIGKKTLVSELTGNGQIKRFHARFACGENGTLHLNPYVILNGNITINLCDFAKGSDNYISGDNEDFTFECYVPVETHAVVCLDVENVGEYPSIVDAAVVVQYEDFIEEESIVGYEGINLGRKRR